MRRDQGHLFRNRARLQTPASEFLKITADRYHAMEQRLGEKRDRRDRIVRIGRELPFDLCEFRERIKQLLGSEDGYTRCHYCGTPLDISTLQLDHMTPVSRGGSLGWENLCAACEPCNQQKGALTAEAFAAFRAFLLTINYIDAENLRGRLQRATKLAIDNRRMKARRAELQPAEAMS